MKHLFFFSALVIWFTLSFSSTDIHAKSNISPSVFQSEICQTESDDETTEVLVLIDNVWWVFVYDKDGCLIRAYSLPND